LILGKPCILEERENFKLKLRKEKIEDLFSSKRKVKIYMEKNDDYDDVPVEIKEQFKNFDHISDKKSFLLNFLKSDDLNVLLYCSEQYNNAIFYLELNEEKFLFFKEIFDKEIIDLYFSLLAQHNYLPLQVLNY
jgi:hypothetical protein